MLPVAAALVLLSLTAAAPAADDRIGSPGDHTLTLQHGGLTRQARVHVPPGYTPTRPLPLVLSFHGGGGDMTIQADDRFYGLVSQADRAPYIAVFPNGWSPLPSGRLATWNAGLCCAGARDRNVDDVGFVRALLRRLQGELAIDADRIYASGMSNGAMFAYRLACEMPETIRAIAAVAGTDGMPAASCRPQRPVSVIAFHARDDANVRFDGGAGAGSRSRADFVSVPETVARWVDRNGCGKTPRRVLDKPGAWCDAWAPCNGNAEVRLCVTETGGHSWPGGFKVRTGERGSAELSATELMWEFFSQH